MTVDVAGPIPGRVDLQEALREIRRAANPKPFSPATVNFCAAFSAALQRDAEARLFPELKVLAFHLRRAAVAELQRQFECLDSGDCILVPRGLVFHIPPANVDTIFIYSWVLAALTGNSNIIRLSSRESPQTSILLRIFGETARATRSDELLSTTLFLRYGHDRSVTAAISSETDLRVIWGGDHSVNDIRSVPLPPHAREVTFPDRSAMSAIRATAYLEAHAPERADLASRFYNDTYWFDQAGCSSPRLLVWVGRPEACAAASQSFMAELEAQIELREYRLSTGAFLRKLTFAYDAVANGGISSYNSPSNELCVLSLENLKMFRRDHPGGGLLFECLTGALSDLVEIIERRDQTLTYFGFAREELTAFARSLNGRGLDRMVPIGEALNFHRYWDGYDLLQEMTRRVHISGAPAAADCHPERYLLQQKVT
jgi:hypothetical protein